MQGTLVVASVVPSNTVCSPGGTGWLNYFNYKTGGAVDETTHKASIKYDAPIVGINIIYIQGQPKVEVVTSSDPTPTLSPGVAFAPKHSGYSNKRTIWRELKKD